MARFHPVLFLRVNIAAPRFAMIDGTRAYERGPIPGKDLHWNRIMILIRNLRSTTALIIVAALLSSGVSIADGVSEAVQNRLVEAVPELAGSVITESPIPGLYEVMQGGQVNYISADGKYLIQGDVFDTTTELNLTEGRREAARKSALAQVSESSMIIFRPENVKYSVSVFTDIDCGYCRKLHRQIAEYNALGIQVRYLSFPRNGPGTMSWFKAENVWCAKDRNAALTQAKTGAAVQSHSCDSTPVAQHYELGRALGVRGTPAIVMQTGELIPGYVEPSELLKYLQEG